MNHILLFLTIVFLACSKPVEKRPEIKQVSLGVSELADYPKYLSEWNLFEEPMKELKPKGEKMFSYEINATLFSDYASKARFIKLPDEGLINYHETEVLDFPEKTILIKNFYYTETIEHSDRRLIETRLLINEEKGWKAVVYQWNEEQTDAKRVLLGKKVPVEFNSNDVLQRVNYKIPSQPQCKSCHDLSGKMTPIGPSARQLNKNNQLSKWKDNGWLNVKDNIQFPKLTDYTDDNAVLDLRARAWLEVNCAHCHRKEGPAKNSGLYLLASETDQYRIGVNKPTIAAGKGSGGLKYSIVPGRPGQSILVHRIESLEPGEMMPELGRTISHKEGVELIKNWIAQMR